PQGVEVTCQASLTRQPCDSQYACSASSSPRLSASSSSSLTRAGRFAKRLNAARLSLTTFSLSIVSVPPQRWATVVKAAPSPVVLTGQAGRNTGGGEWCQARPQSGKLADGDPTVSPTLKYASWGGMSSPP